MGKKKQSSSKKGIIILIGCALVIIAEYLLPQQ